MLPSVNLHIESPVEQPMELCRVADCVDTSSRPRPSTRTPRRPRTRRHRGDGRGSSRPSLRLHRPLHTHTRGQCSPQRAGCLCDEEDMLVMTEMIKMMDELKRLRHERAQLQHEVNLIEQSMPWLDEDDDPSDE